MKGQQVTLSLLTTQSPFSVRTWLPFRRGGEGPEGPAGCGAAMLNAHWQQKWGHTRYTQQGGPITMQSHQPKSQMKCVCSSVPQSPWSMSFAKDFGAFSSCTGVTTSSTGVSVWFSPAWSLFVPRQEHCVWSLGIRRQLSRGAEQDTSTWESGALVLLGMWSPKLTGLCAVPVLLSLSYGLCTKSQCSLGKLSNKLSN